MTLSLTAQAVPLRTDASGTIRRAGSRVTLDIVVSAFNEGTSPAEIVQQLPTLELAQVYTVVAFD